ncbi:uncharacterized protein [Zea mays]|uniref:NAC domain-containing protein n=2 Tax=Zea mays TaxID=4577 RepID=A0A804MRY6_MAIZE|nr:uncharacterized protein LOC103647756 [Zea mays]|eukprot:XP_023157526.1 uncharacterized protein LOC103647756 [Zea mays]
MEGRPGGRPESRPRRVQQAGSGRWRADTQVRAAAGYEYVSSNGVIFLGAMPSAPSHSLFPCPHAPPSPADRPALLHRNISRGPGESTKNPSADHSTAACSIWTLPTDSVRLSATEPGFRFDPTDEELVVHYLKKKAAIIAFTSSIRGSYLCACLEATFGEQEWYSSPRDHKY